MSRQSAALSANGQVIRSATRPDAFSSPSDIDSDAKVIQAEDAVSPDERPPAFTDEALALEFAKVHAGNLRYVAAWGKWFSFNGERWEFDRTLLAFSEARRVCRQASFQCNDSSVAKALASAGTVSAVIKLAKSDQRLAAKVDQWDSDPWLLNTAAGVVNLRTGNLRLHRPDDYMTKITGVSTDPSCPTPHWAEFLHRVTNGDEALTGFLQRVAGYALTGATHEHALFFTYGTGANGKSTFVNAIAGCLGDYHRTAPLETFTESKSDRHPTDLAGLRGARMVTAIETEEGRHWAESRIKTLTGGDKISARFMRQDFFEFTPQFKLLIAGNHRPSLRAVDEAMRRRFHLIPFTVTIPREERDPALPDKLKPELPGILASMIEGCLQWQSQGLAPPQAVREATDAYLEAEDSLAAWLAECCERDPNAWESNGALFKSWSIWADAAGEPAGSQTRLSERLEAHGFERKRTAGARGFRSIRLLPAAPSDHASPAP
jgi:putative DNA primase/helicase